MTASLTTRKREHDVPSDNLRTLRASRSILQTTNKRPLVTALNLWTVLAFANNLSHQRTPYVQRSATDDVANLCETRIRALMRGGEFARLLYKLRNTDNKQLQRLAHLFLSVRRCPQVARCI